MDSFNPTTRTQQAISAAVQAATLAGNPDVGPTHLLGALLAQGEAGGEEGESEKRLHDGEVTPRMAWCFVVSPSEDPRGKKWSQGGSNP